MTKWQQRKTRAMTSPGAPGDDASSGQPDCYPVPYFNKSRTQGSPLWLKSAWPEWKCRAEKTRLPACPRDNVPGGTRHDSCEVRRSKSNFTMAPSWHRLLLPLPFA